MTVADSNWDTFILECDDSEATIAASDNWDSLQGTGWEETSSCPNGLSTYNGTIPTRYFYNLLPGYTLNNILYYYIQHGQDDSFFLN